MIQLQLTFRLLQFLFQNIRPCFFSKTSNNPEERLHPRCSPYFFAMGSSVSLFFSKSGYVVACRPSPIRHPRTPPDFCFRPSTAAHGAKMRVSFRPCTRRACLSG